MGDWRVIYRIDDRDHLVDIASIRHRREAYR
ncbi:MAG: type II toxin-antitoxin system RelE family toxin [Pyrinomonadaceae bacterium]